jgi:AI2M/AI1M-like HNH endonuclease
VSLVKTLAKKYKTSCTRIYKRMGTLRETEQGVYKVIEVRVERGANKAPLVAYFGGIPLRWNKWVSINETVEPIWGKRREIVQRLLRETCELCGATATLQAHHVRKLADLTRNGQRDVPLWVRRMVARRRKSLMVCQRCHDAIHFGRYDGPAFSNRGHWRAT